MAAQGDPASLQAVHVPQAVQVPPLTAGPAVGAGRAGAGRLRVLPLPEPADRRGAQPGSEFTVRTRAHLLTEVKTTTIPTAAQASISVSITGKSILMNSSNLCNYELKRSLAKKNQSSHFVRDCLSWQIKLFQVKPANTNKLYEGRIIEQF